MPVPGFTAGASLYKTRKYYEVPLDWEPKSKEQVVMSKGYCKPKCGPCVGGVKECVTFECEPYEKPCSCPPRCGPCRLNPSKGPGGWQLCKRKDCSEYWQQCTPPPPSPPSPQSPCPRGGTWVNGPPDCPTCCYVEGDGGYCTYPLCSK